MVPRSAAQVQATGGAGAPAPARDVYLDYAAATPLDPRVLSAMEPYLTRCFENPSAPYARARAARDAVEGARADIAHLMGAKPDGVIFTAGATEANNLAFAATDGGVVTDAAEHESVLACAQARGAVVVGVGADGRVDPERLCATIGPTTQLISVELANGEVGVVQPVREIARRVAAVRQKRLAEGSRVPLWLHTDASQAAGSLSCNVTSLGADMVTLSAA